ncbi:hypothetical protein D0Z07_4838 [Hyphodiscus hymeniophilus]|uniref:Uncharacterized protein n=1 Tax=Hyphodiscus hymeniophilus TaxID=353542 RepID=A0A9P6VJC4_9HELO|nr:hypothetical protein D0Z07_4838 [Hyphodiscus hymeniophilus]
MLDENLPTFYIKPSSDSHLTNTIYLSHNASELQPEYTLRHPDPNLPASKNCYAIALYDSYNPEVLFAEVLVQPEWTQPTLSAAEVRAQNGVPPPPVPVVPNSFAVQLYNPDQQVTVRQIPGSWNSSAYWEFEMPQNTFRLPSASALDRSQSDPSAADTTPKVAFKWKRDGKLSKDISCTLSGKSTEGRKNKEPDITVAMFKGGKTLTIYQPNMHRVDVEDVKGLEVVFLLSAAVIKDIYFNVNREMFNISSQNIANTRRKNSGPVIAGKSSSPPSMSGAAIGVAPPSKRQNIPSSQIPPQQAFRPQQQQQQSIPPTNAGSQWEIDAETARLRALVEAEEKERARLEREEEQRIKKMLEEEERARKRRDSEVAKETERLRKQYGVSGQDIGPRASFTSKPPMPPRPQNQQYRPGEIPQYQSTPTSRPAQVPRPSSTPGLAPGATYYPQTNQWVQEPPPGPVPNSPYLQPPGKSTASSSGFFGLGGKKVQKKRSVFF